MEWKVHDLRLNSQKSASRGKETKGKTRQSNLSSSLVQMTFGVAFNSVAVFPRMIFESHVILR